MIRFLFALAGDMLQGALRATPPGRAIENGAYYRGYHAALEKLESNPYPEERDDYKARWGRFAPRWFR